MTSRRRIETQLTADEKDLLRGLAAARRELRQYEDQVAKAGVTTGKTQQPARGLTSDLGALHSKALLVAGGIGAATAAAYTAGRAIGGLANAASDVNESLNKNNVVFGQASRAASSFADTSAQSFGLSKRAALEATGAYGSMFRTIGLGEPVAAQMSVRLTQLAADMASFNNQDPSEMLQKLRSGLAGEAEPLRTVGVLLSEARVKEEAYAAGIAKRGAELTEAEKVQARYNLILKDTTLQHGDFARTSEGLANRQRHLSAEFDNLKVKIGEGLVGPMTGAVTITAGLIENVNKLVDLAKKPIDFTVNVNGEGGAAQGDSGGISWGKALLAGPSTLAGLIAAGAVGKTAADIRNADRFRRGLAAGGAGLALDGNLPGFGDAASVEFAIQERSADPYARGFNGFDWDLLTGSDSERWKGFMAGAEAAKKEREAAMNAAASGGGSGGAASRRLGLSAFGLSRVDALMGQLPGTPGSRDIAAFNAAELKFKTLTREIETDLAKLNLTMADLRARGQENTDTYRLLTDESDALSDASARLRYEQTLRLDTVRDSIEAERELQEAQEERAKSMLRIADELTERLTRGNNLSPQSWLATRGIAAAVAAVGPDGATAGDLDAINVAVSRANEITNARNPEIRATVQVELKSSDLSTPGEP